MNKSYIANALASIIAIIGLVLDNQLVFMVGLFAVSGAVTNAIAIHMLFEKVPFLYGSGVVENRFVQFKEGIHSLMMNEFFSQKRTYNAFF